MIEGLHPEGPVLDLGCGTGLVTRHLLGAGRAVLALDADAGMLARLPRRGLPLAVRADGARLPLATGAFANVVLANVIHVVDDPAAVLREALRVCAPGGRIVVTWPVDGLHPRDLSRTERRLGRSRRDAGRATFLRLVTGAPGAVLRVRRWRTRELRRQLDGEGHQPSWQLLEDTVVRGTVHLRTYGVRVVPAASTGVGAAGGP